MPNENHDTISIIFTAGAEVQTRVNHETYFDPLSVKPECGHSIMSVSSCYGPTEQLAEPRILRTR